MLLHQLSKLAKKRIILASSSPRRKEVLEKLVCIIFVPEPTTVMVQVNKFWSYTLPTNYNSNLLFVLVLPQIRLD